MCWVAMGYLESERERVEFQIHHLAGVLQWWVVRFEIEGLSADVAGTLSTARKLAQQRA